MNTGSNKVLALFGPTACGKTELLERLFDGPSGLVPVRAVVVSADSMQAYRGMDIGTAKPGAELLARLPHELVDIIDPGEVFGAGDFVRRADEACARAISRDALPVVSGGTAFYVKCFVLGMPSAPPSDPGIRARVKADLAEKGVAAMRRELESVDPASASRIAPADVYRLSRAIEVQRLSGRALSSFTLPVEPRSRWDVLALGIERPRAELYARIDARVDAMLAAGLLDEVRNLLERGYSRGDPGLRGIGYAELAPVAGHPGSPGLDEAVELVKRNTRRYAKRQITFMKGLPGVRWFGAMDHEGVAAAVNRWLGAGSA